MSVVATVVSKLTVVEQLAGNAPFASDKQVQHDGLNENSKVLSPAVYVAAFQKAMSGGAGTIDLTALVGTNGGTVDGTGLRVQGMKIRNPSTNANSITIKEGASNGYDGFGAAFSLTLSPGATALIVPNDAGSDIGATKCTLDLVGALTQALDVIVVLG